MAKEDQPAAKKDLNQPAVERDEIRDQDELRDDELDEASGGMCTLVTNLANMRHEMLKAVANNLRG